MSTDCVRGLHRGEQSDDEDEDEDAVTKSENDKRTYWSTATAFPQCLSMFLSSSSERICSAEAPTLCK